MVLILDQHFVLSGLGLCYLGSFSENGEVERRLAPDHILWFALLLLILTRGPGATRSIIWCGAARRSR